MGFDISNLGSYVLNNGKEYATASVAKAKTAKALIDSKNVQFGVKGTSAILKLSSDVVLIDGSGCGARTGGSTVTLSNKNIVVKPIKDETNICPSTLWNTFYATSISAGQHPQEDLIPVFAEAIMNDRANKIAAVNEKLLWQGDTTLTGSTNYKRIDGILKQVTSNVTTTTTGSTIVEKLQAFYMSNDVDVRGQEDYVIAIGEDTYANYKIALAGKNIYQPTEDSTLFGTTAKLFVTSGLNGTSKIVGTRFGNLQLGLDGQGDSDKAEMRFSIETNQWYQDFTFALGVSVIWANEAKYATV